MDSACDTPLLEWVAPFGNPRIKACSRLPKACRSVPRPSSPLGAKASTRCPCFPRPTPATTAPLHPTRPTTPPDGKPALDARMDEFKQQLALQKALPPAERTAEPAYPCHFDTPTHRRKKRGRRIACQRPSRARTAPEALRGTSCARGRASHHHHTMSKEQDPCSTGCARHHDDATAELRGRGFPFGTAGSRPKPRGPASKGCELGGPGPT